MAVWDVLGKRTEDDGFVVVGAVKAPDVELALVLERVRQRDRAAHAVPEQEQATGGMTLPDDSPESLEVRGEVGEPLDVLIRLGAQRSGDHPPRALPRQLVQRERDLLAALLDRERAKSQ